MQFPNIQSNFLISGQVFILYRHFKLLNIYCDDKKNVINNLMTLYSLMRRYEVKSPIVK